MRLPTKLLLTILLVVGVGAGILIANGTLRPQDVTSAPERQLPRSVTTTVTRVVDGDTIMVAAVPGVIEATSGTAHTVRLLGVDAPEMNPEGSSEPACGATDARTQLERLLAPGTVVTLTWDARADRTDRYGRSLAYLEYQHQGQTRDVGAHLVEWGYVSAWYPAGEPRPERADLYEKLQSEAQRGRGSWSTCGTLGR